ncbi:MAG: ABC transporter permease subunit [Eubacteriales bacterium]|nr:ABC transporter permease subunit [Eubacteriales bacterium]
MKAIYMKELKLTRKLLLIWIALIVILTGFAAIEFIMLKDAVSDIAALSASFPKMVLVLFGMNGARVDTPLGAYQSMVYWTNLLAYFFAGFLGVYAVAREEKFGTGEFLFSKPYTRTAIIRAKILASGTSLALFALVTGIMSYLCILLPLQGGHILGIHIATTIGMFLTQLVLFSVGLFLSGLVGNYKTASLLTMLAVLIFYGISFVLDYYGITNYLNMFTPVRYFDVVSIAGTGLRPAYILLSALIILSCCGLAGLLYKKRDLRI